LFLRDEQLLRYCIFALEQEGIICEVLPPPSCLNEASVLICSILKYANEPESVIRHKIEALLQVWADLIAEWSAWEEDEDLAVFEAIQEAIILNVGINLILSCLYVPLEFFPFGYSLEVP
jgi:hypothetical protein